jgi:hypothetical protein
MRRAAVPELATERCGRAPDTLQVLAGREHFFLTAIRFRHELPPNLEVAPQELDTAHCE